MKETMLLSRYEYAMLSSTMTVSSLAFLEKDQFGTRVPLVTIKIDFEKGNFYLEGNRQFMMFSKRTRKIKELIGQQERVKVESSLFPGAVIDLHDPSNDGLFFTMDGSILYGGMMKTCTGLMLLENIRDKRGRCSQNWSVSFNLQVVTQKEYEIKFKIPVYASMIGEEWN